MPDPSSFDLILAAETRRMPLASKMVKITDAAMETTAYDGQGSPRRRAITQPFTEATPAPAMTAPIRPPKRACEELDGRPRSQVIRFHTIAPINPARMTEAVISWSSKNHRRSSLRPLWRGRHLRD